MLVQFKLEALPPTLNQQINSARTNRFHSAQIKRQWTGDIEIEARRQLPRIYFEKVWLAYEWTVPTFAFDEDNVASAAKFVMDGLTKAGVLRNDNLTVIQSPVLRSYQRGGGGLTLWLSDSPLFLHGQLMATIESQQIEWFVTEWSRLFPDFDLVEDDDCPGIFLCPQYNIAIAAISLASEQARSRCCWYAAKRIPLFPVVTQSEILSLGAYFTGIRHC